jgi:RNA recognition motif-containing protein
MTTTTLIVTNLPHRVTGRDIREAFEPLGFVWTVRIPKMDRSDQNRGFAFVEMNDDYDATIAIRHLNGTVFRGKIICVDRAKAA